MNGRREIWVLRALGHAPDAEGALPTARQAEPSHGGVPGEPWIAAALVQAESADRDAAPSEALDRAVLNAARAAVADDAASAATAMHRIPHGASGPSAALDRLVLEHAALHRQGALPDEGAEQRQAAWARGVATALVATQARQRAHALLHGSVPDHSGSIDRLATMFVGVLPRKDLLVALFDQLRTAVTAHVQDVSARSIGTSAPALTAVLHIERSLRSLAMKEPRSAKALAMRFYAGFSDKQVCEALSVPPAVLLRDWERLRIAGTPELAQVLQGTLPLTRRIVVPATGKAVSPSPSPEPASPLDRPPAADEVPPRRTPDLPAGKRAPLRGRK